MQDRTLDVHIRSVAHRGGTVSVYDQMLAHVHKVIHLVVSTFDQGCYS